MDGVMDSVRDGRSEISSAWQLQFPPLQPHDGGWLDVGEGHQLHWTCSGHPGAPAVLFVHGGPGAGCTSDDRRWFDPQRWRIVQFDQRGAGLSRAEDLLHANTTPHLLADMEALRIHLGIGRWALFGGSWGATLALAYAQQHAQQVSGLVLRGVFTATRAEACWLYGTRGAAACHPAAWQRLCAAAGAETGTRLLDAMHIRLQGHDQPAVAAAQAWWQWEHALMDSEADSEADSKKNIETDSETDNKTTGPAVPCRTLPDSVALAQARIGVHYARHHWFLADGQLLAQAGALHGLPGFIVQGQRDRITPPAAARALHAVWPQALWHGVPAAGHASSHPGIARHLIAATESLASRISHLAPTNPTQETHHG